MRHHEAGRTIRLPGLLLCVVLAPLLFILGHAAAQIAPADSNAVAFSYGFLELDDPRVVADANGVAMLTFACFGEDDNLLWTRGFASIDAWCTYARNDPNLSAQKTEQTGWALCLGDEEIFWPLQALLYICPSVRDTVAAIESRPLVYDRFARACKVPHIEFTDGENLCQQPSATVPWNPTIPRPYRPPVPMDSRSTPSVRSSPSMYATCCSRTSPSAATCPIPCIRCASRPAGSAAPSRPSGRCWTPTSRPRSRRS